MSELDGADRRAASDNRWCVAPSRSNPRDRERDQAASREVVVWWSTRCVYLIPEVVRTEAHISHPGWEAGDYEAAAQGHKERNGV